MQEIVTPDAPRPAGHYVQGLAHGGFVFVAGQLPLDPATGALVGAGDIAAQTERTLANVAAVLAAGGSDLSRVVSLTVYVTSVELWPSVNEACARCFGAHRPTRAVVPVPALRHGCMIEMQAIGAL
jgi:2-iminobutanoate/2-iminopropanoate deaminase